MQSTTHRRWLPLISLLVHSLAIAGVLLLPPTWPRLGAALLLTCFLPGWALVLALDPQARLGPTFPARLLTGAGLSYALTIIAGLWLAYLFGRLTLPLVLTLTGLVGLVGFGVALGRVFWGSASPSTPKGVHQPLLSPLLGGRASGKTTATWWLVAILLLSSYFAFYALSYSDLRGDEAEVVLRAVALRRGVDDPLLSHTKGPAEILLTVTMGELAGAYDELAVRLPFALASVLTVGATYLVGAGLFGPRVGLLAAVLMATNGWLVSHSRTAQYQNVLLFVSVLAIWQTWRYNQTQRASHLGLAVIFAVTALLAHYDGAAILPALAYLFWRGTTQTDEALPGAWRRWLRPSILGPLVAGLAILLTFYLPFFRNPHIDRTQSYLANFFTGQQFIFNNWDTFYVNGLFYNSIYFVGGLGFILLLGVLRGIALLAGRRGLVVALVALPLLLLSWTGLLPPWYALALFLLLLGLFLTSARVSPPVKVILLWAWPPLLLYLFIVVRPGNHYYVAIPSILILAALTIDWLVRYLAGSSAGWRRIALPALVGVLLLLFGLSAWYEQLVFMRTDLEYMLTYPENRNPLFWSDPRYPFDIRIGWGFPYRLGWQTISDLYRRGDLAGDWYANDNNNTIQWYTTGQPRNPCFPRYFMLTEVGYEEPPLPVPQAIIDAYYSHTATVEVYGRPRLRLYEFDPGQQAPTPVVYQEPAPERIPYRPDLYTATNPLRDPFPQPAVPLEPARSFKPHPEMLAKLATVYDDPNFIRLSEVVQLDGYTVDQTLAKPGGVVMVTLHWSTAGAVILPYKVFTHLLQDGAVMAQADSEPACGFHPTYEWRQTAVVDRHAIFLPPDLPPGEYALEIGLYELRTGLRMDVLDQMGNPAGNSLSLPPVTISAP